VNYRQLEIFRAVMDAGSATAAARLLDLSQPAVSRQLAQIESELGLDLFARERGKLMPTAHATALYDEVAYAFEGVERVLNLASKMRANNTGTLRIAAPHSFCEVLLPRTVARLAAVHRNLRYAVELGRYEAVRAMVAKREVDVGILKEPVEHAGISTLPLIACGAACVLPRRHRLAGLRVVKITDIAAEPLVLLGRDTPWRHEIYALFRRAGRTPAVKLETHTVAAACGFVENELGVSIVPEVIAAQFAHRGIVLRPLATGIEHRFVVAFPKGLQRAGLVAEFAREARHVARAILRDSRPAAAVSTAARSGGHRTTAMKGST
jgi:DNA-binding transcriptional LysR family regulator